MSNNILRIPSMNHGSRSLKTALLYFALITSVLCFFAIIRLQNYVTMRPASVHLWAQCDRASVALNFFQNSNNIFYPRTHHTRGGTGITGMEFPAVNYITGNLYRIFGYNDSIYRIVMAAFTAVGLIYGMLIGITLTGSIAASIAITAFWYFTPLMGYYSANFIPDMASMALVLVYWYYFLRINLEQKAKQYQLILLLGSAVLATLIKITAWMHVTASFVVILYIVNSKGSIRSNPINKSLLRSQLFGLLIALITTLAWYGYAGHLSRVYTGGIFLMKMNPALNINDLSASFTKSLEYFSSFLLNTPQLIVYTISIYLMIIMILKGRKLLLVCILTLITEGLAYYLLMAHQFIDHDYYYLLLYPFLLLLLYHTYNNLHVLKAGSAGMVFVSLLFIGLTIYSGIYTSKKIKSRFLEGPGKEMNAYIGMDNYLDSLGIKRNDLVISFYDNSPNISLYFMNRKGWTLGVKETQNYTKLGYEAKASAYIIPSDVKKINSELKLLLADKIGEYNNVSVYRNHSKYSK